MRETLKGLALAASFVAAGAAGAAISYRFDHKAVVASETAPVAQARVRPSARRRDHVASDRRAPLHHRRPGDDIADQLNHEQLQ